METIIAERAAGKLNLSDMEMVALVERYLEPVQPKDHRLNVVGLRHDGDYVYVVVQPTRDDIRVYDYYNMLAEVENEIEDRENINVLLVPVLPGA